jgi:hypothetical protein
MLNPVRPPRRFIVRLLLAGLLDFALIGTGSTLDPIVEDATGSHTLGSLTVWFLAAPFVVWLAPKVSYRRRDALLAPWVFLIVAWRIAYLPYRDWPPRDDEMGQARYLSAAELPTHWRPEYNGLWRMPATSNVRVAVDAA